MTWYTDFDCSQDLLVEAQWGCLIARRNKSGICSRVFTQTRLCSTGRSDMSDHLAWPRALSPHRRVFSVAKMSAEELT